jgi:hypothetical protein
MRLDEGDLRPRIRVGGLGKEDFWFWLWMLGSRATVPLDESERREWKLGSSKAHSVKVVKIIFRLHQLENATLSYFLAVITLLSPLQPRILTSIFQFPYILGPLTFSSYRN